MDATSTNTRDACPENRAEEGRSAGWPASAPGKKGLGEGGRIGAGRLVILAVAVLITPGCGLTVNSTHMVTEAQLPALKLRTMDELQICTGLKWTPRPVTFQLLQCQTQDHTGRCWRWGGHSLVGATTLGHPEPTIRICSCDLRQVHRDVVRHELLHVLLLQHGISGHPEEFANCAAEWKSYQDEVPAQWDVYAPPRTSLLGDGH